jgi:hypothetical protein
MMKNNLTVDHAVVLVCHPPDKNSLAKTLQQNDGSPE